LFRKGDGHAEAGAATGFAENEFNLTPERTGIAPADGESQARAFRRALGREPLLEQSAAIFLGDTNAVVDDIDEKIVLTFDALEMNRSGASGFGHGLIGVAQQVRQNLNEFVAI